MCVFIYAVLKASQDLDERGPIRLYARVLASVKTHLSIPLERGSDLITQPTDRLTNQTENRQKDRCGDAAVSALRCGLWRRSRYHTRRWYVTRKS
jgi:hypothetical protein